MVSKANTGFFFLVTSIRRSRGAKATSNLGISIHLSLLEFLYMKKGEVSKANTGFFFLVTSIRRSRGAKATSNLGISIHPSFQLISPAFILENLIRIFYINKTIN